jgi:transmembrane protein
MWVTSINKRLTAVMPQEHANIVMWPRLSTEFARFSVYWKAKNRQLNCTGGRMKKFDQWLPFGPMTQGVLRLLLTFPFWESGLTKLVDFQGGMAEMAHFGLEPPALFNAATILVQLGGTALLQSRQLSWIGAGALIVFTALTIPLVHHFWSLQGPDHLNALHMANEHLAVMAALAFVALSDLKRAR